jgi:uncharacterized Zn finger protein
MTKKTSPPQRIELAVVEKRCTDSIKDVERAKKKMDAAKKAVGWAKSLAGEYPTSETFASAITAINAYIEATDRYAASVCKREARRIANGNAVRKYYESFASHRYRQGKKAQAAKSQS